MIYISSKPTQSFMDSYYRKDVKVKTIYVNIYTTM